MAVALLNRCLRDMRVADTGGGLEASEVVNSGSVLGASSGGDENENNNQMKISKSLKRPRAVRHLPWVIGLVTLIPTYVALTNCLELFYAGPRSSEFWIQLGCLLTYEFYRDTLFYVRLYEWLGWIYPKVRGGRR